MFRKDYLMRLIEQFIQTLLQVLFKIKSGQITGATESLEVIYTSYLGLSRDAVAAMSDRQILALFGGEDRIGSDKCIMLAELFYAETLLLPSGASEDERNQLTLRAIRFYLNAMHKTDLWDGTEAREHFHTLLEICPLASIPAPLLRLLSDYYDRIGQTGNSVQVDRVLTRLHQ